MIYRTTKEILSEIRHFMFLNDISIKELALRMHKSHQSVSLIFFITVSIPSFHGTDGLPAALPHSDNHPGCF